jgi:hypothetical protein
MARQAMTNGFLSCFMHVGLALVLLAYLPVAFVCRLVYRLLVRPFVSGEDLRGKVVLVTGASSGIGEVSLPYLVPFVVQFIMFLLHSSMADTYARFHGVPFVE